MSKPIPKRLLAWLLAAMVALVVAPSAAFADGLAAGNLAAQEGGVIKVYQMAADGTEAVAKEFTQAELEALAKENTQEAKYFWFGKGKLSVAVATKYVTIDQLATAAGLEFEEGDTVNAVGSDGFAGTAYSYDALKAGKYFPAYTTNGKSVDGAIAVPGVLALEYGLADTTDNATTIGSLEAAAKAKTASGIRNFWGFTAEDVAQGNIGGKPFITGAAELHITKAFNVYTSTGNGAKTLVKQYTPDQLKALATNASSSVEARGYLFNKEGWQVGVATSYIPIKTLLSDAGITLQDGMLVKATAADNFSSNLSYDQIVNGKYFYPATTPKELVDAGAEDVGTVLALTWGVDSVKTTAGEAKVAVADAADKLMNQTRIFTGLRSTKDDQTGGNRFATGPVELTVVTVKDVKDCTISGVKASYKYTGKAIEPKVVVKDGTTKLTAFDPEMPKKGGDYTIAIKKNIKVGTATIIIKGMNAYKGTLKKTFKITQATNKAVAKKTSVSKTFKANKKTGKLAAAKIVALPKVTTVFGKAKWQVTKADAKKVLTLKSGKVRVKKGASKGTYTIKLKAKVAKAANYKAASTKTVTVKVKVK